MSFYFLVCFRVGFLSSGRLRQYVREGYSFFSVCGVVCVRGIAFCAIRVRVLFVCGRFRDGMARAACARLSFAVLRQYWLFRHVAVPTRVVAGCFVFRMYPLWEEKSTCPCRSASWRTERRFVRIPGCMIAGRSSCMSRSVVGLTVPWCVAPVYLDVAVCVVSGALSFVMRGTL